MHDNDQLANSFERLKILCFQCEMIDKDFVFRGDADADAETLRAHLTAADVLEQLPAGDPELIAEACQLF